MLYRVGVNKVAQPEAQQYDAGRPYGGTYDVIEQKLTMGHFAHARYYRRKCAHYRNETRHDKGFGAMLLVESFVLGNVFLAKQYAVLLAEQPRPQRAAQCIPYVVANNGCRKNNQYNPGERQVTLRCKETS